MQNCNRLKRSGLVRVKRPGTAYDVSLREFENSEVLSSTISLSVIEFKLIVTLKNELLFLMNNNRSLFYSVQYFECSNECSLFTKPKLSFD